MVLMRLDRRLSFIRLATWENKSRIFRKYAENTWTARSWNYVYEFYVPIDSYNKRSSLLGDHFIYMRISCNSSGSLSFALCILLQQLAAIFFSNVVRSIMHIMAWNCTVHRWEHWAIQNEEHSTTELRLLIVFIVGITRGTAAVSCTTVRQVSNFAFPSFDFPRCYRNVSYPALRLF